MNKGPLKVALFCFFFFINAPMMAKINNQETEQAAEADEASAFFEETLQEREQKQSDSHQPLSPRKGKRSNLEKKALAWLVWCAVKGESALQSITSLKNRFLAWIWHEKRNA